MYVCTVSTPEEIEKSSPAKIVIAYFSINSGVTTFTIYL